MTYIIGWICYLILPAIPIDWALWRLIIPKAAYYAYFPEVP
jgi:hypothetical protein